MSGAAHSGPAADRVAGIAAGLAVATLFVFPVAGIMAKQAMAPLFVLTAALCIGLAAARARPALMPDRMLLVWFAAFALFAAVNQVAVARCAGCGPTLAAALAMLAMIGWVAGGPVLREAGPAAGRLLPALGLGLAGAGLALLVELTLDAPLYRAANGLGAETPVAPSRYNRGASALMVLVWPLAAWIWLAGRRRIGAAPAALAALAAVAAALGLAGLSQSVAALLAGLAAILAFALALVLRRLASHIVIAAAMAAILAAPLVGGRLLDHVSGLRDYFVPSAWHRIEIWDHAAGRILDSPLTGWGLGAHRFLPVTVPGGREYRLLDQPATHPHNGALQIWVEGGAVGAALALWLLWLVGRRLAGLPAPLLPFALASLAALLVFAMLSFGLWQQSWMAVIAMTALCFQAAASAGETAPPPDRASRAPTS